MLDITIENFEAELVNASLEQPVLLDIWAPWCGPCKVLGPVLETLETAYAGRFKLAKVNSDDQPEIAGQLSQMFGVRSIPFCVLFKDGQPVDGFVGALPQSDIRAFLDKHVAPPTGESAMGDDEVGVLEAAAAEGDGDSTMKKLESAFAEKPENDDLRAEFIGSLLTAGRVEEARKIQQGASAASLLVHARLKACGQWIAAHDATASGRSEVRLRAAIVENKRDFAARHELAQRLWAEGKTTDALDELLEILMRDKSWGNEAARQTYIAILACMAKPTGKASEPVKAANSIELVAVTKRSSEDTTIDAYRRRLSMVLF